MPLLWLFVSTCAAVLLAYFGIVVLLRTLSHKLLDVPNVRSSHDRPTPRGGGLAIVCVVVIGIAAYATSFDAWRELSGFLLGGVVVAAISLADDVFKLSAAARLPVQLMAAFIAVGHYTGWSGIEIDGVGVPVQLVLTMFWIVGLTNAYNFMDGIDGIAGAQGIVAGLAWTAAGVLLDAHAVATIGVLIAAACAGFLKHNWPPARIFLGDVGAAFLGYSFAVLPLMVTAAGARVGFAAFAFVAVFVFDTSYTFMRRAGRREHVWQAHRSHLYQRLVITGRSHAQVTSLYVTLAALLAIGGVATLPPSGIAPVVVAIAVAVVGAALIVYVHRCEQRAVPHGQARAPIAGSYS